MTTEKEEKTIQIHFRVSKNEYDIIFFGSSHAYCSFNPLKIWEATGVKSYIFATQQQPLWATYYYMKDAFKRQSPDIAFLDVFMFSKNDEYYDEGVNYTFCDNMPFSFDKIRLAAVSAPKGERFGLLFRIVKYHSRWNELTETDYEYRKGNMHDYSKGQYILTSVCPDAVYYDVENVAGRAELSDKNRLYLDKIIKLCREKNVRLVLVNTPSNMTLEEKEYYNSVKDIAGENGVEYVDYNADFEKIGLDIKTDFFDKAHLNVYGSEKFTDYFIKNTDYFSGKQRTDSDWESDLARYSEEKKAK